MKKFFPKHSDPGFAPHAKFGIMTRGFTLIELLVVLGILAILATVVIMVINPAQLIKQSRDATRLSDIETISKAILLYQSTGASSMGNANTVYISVPALNSNCSDLNLPALNSGWSYACVTSANSRNNNGTGWLPIDFTTLSFGSPLDHLPIDPTNATSSGLYYTYIKGSFALSATMESTQYQNNTAISDSGYSSARYEKGSDLSLNQYIPNCGGQPIAYQGKTYNTVQVGKQCWFQTNLDYDNGCSSATWTNNTDTGWCGYYTGGPFAGEGLLYQWSALMNGATSDGAQGLCPSGWHIASDSEWHTLENYLTDSGQTCNGSRVNSYDCSGAGTKLKSGGTSGFNLILSGQRAASDGSFGYRSSYGLPWSSTQCGTTCAYEHTFTGGATIERSQDGKAYAYPVRCLRNY